MFVCQVTSNTNLLIFMYSLKQVSKCLTFIFHLVYFCRTSMVNSLIQSYLWNGNSSMMSVHSSGA